MIFRAGLTILKKVRCLGRLSGRGADPEVALHLRQVNSVVAGVDGHMADDQVRTSSKVARGTPKWRSS